MKEHGKLTRYIELIDDIGNHVFQWATDEDWSKLPPKVNIALTALMNELKIAKALKDAGVMDTNEESLLASKKRFLALFKKKHLEVCDMKFTEPVTPVNQVNITRVINELKAVGGRYEEFIEWFFDDYCTLEENKKFMPPEINYICSNHVLKKYIYKMKDTFRIRQENLAQEAARTILLEVALPFNKRIQDKTSDFARKMVDFDNRNISATKFFDLMKAFAEKYNDTECLASCERLAEKVNEMRNRGV